MSGSTGSRRRKDFRQGEIRARRLERIGDVRDVSDEALVAGLATGDPDATAVFVRRFEGRVYGLALSITREPEAAAEVAQDAFVRAWRYAASFDPRRGPAAAWLLGIARNAALDHLRALGRRLDRPTHDPDGLFTNLVGDEELGSPHDDLATVAAELRALPVEQRETLMAAAYYGFTAREISEAWDVPLGTVKTRLRLAMRRLRSVLAEVTPLRSPATQAGAGRSPAGALSLASSRGRTSD
jgi:RNA polymerase sigma-70 factor (ECF subfamily)